MGSIMAPTRMKMPMIIVTMVIAYACYISFYYHTSDIDDSDHEWIQWNILHLLGSNSTVHVMDNAICDRNKELCNLISHPICKYLMPYPVLRMHHHKTGYALSIHIRSHICSFCNSSCNPQNPIYKSFLAEIKVQNMSQTLDTNDLNHTVLLHFMRTPVDTILSGFYYHRKAREPWLMKPIHTSMYGHHRVLNPHLFNDLIHSRVDETNYYHKYYQSVSRDVELCFIVPNITDGLNRFYRRNISVLLPDMSDTVKHLLGYTQPLGLFWEFIRYFNCEWASQYLMNQIGIKYFGHYHTFNMSFFATHDGFRYNINRLMDALNIVNTERNVEMLRKHGANGSPSYIDEERTQLLHRLGREDLSSRRHLGNARAEAHALAMKQHFQKVNRTSLWEHLQRGKRAYPNVMASFRHRSHQHVTKGTFDKEQAAEVLLTLDHSVCDIIKNMTIWLEFEWNYSEFC
eukprot:113472_1